MPYKYMIIDGSNMAWRAGSVLHLNNQRGENVSVIYGMLSMLRSLIEDYQPERLCICWDTGGSKAKKEFYPDYKKERHASRKLPEEAYKDVAIQIKELHLILPFFGICQISKSGVEADDIIGLLCKQYGKEILVVSGDKGLFQVVNLGASIFYPNKNIVINKYNFYELVGVNLEQYSYYLSIVGHPGGGIPGLKNFGPVTTEKLFTKHGVWINWFLDEKIKNEILEDLNKKQREIMLSNSYQILNTNYKLVLLGGLIEDMKDEFVMSLDSHKSEFDEDVIKEYLKENQFAKYLANFRSWIHPFRKLAK